VRKQAVVEETKEKPKDEKQEAHESMMEAIRGGI